MDSLSRKSNQTNRQLSYSERNELDRRNAKLSEINRLANETIKQSQEAGRKTRNNIHRLANSPVREEKPGNSTRNGPSLWPLFWIVALIVVVYLIIRPSNSNPAANNANQNTPPDTAYTQSQQLTSYQAPQVFNYNSFLLTGIVFPDSNSRELTEADIESLHDIGGYTKADFIQYAINELYARHGFSFKKEKTIQFYNNCTWYKDLGYDYNDDALMKQIFNDCEEHNLAFLSEARKKTKANQ